MIDTNCWQYFKLKDLFTIKSGYFAKKPKHTLDGNIRFLGATKSDNGVTEHYSEYDLCHSNRQGKPDNSLENKIYEGNCIALTINGSVFNAYYQDKNFTCSADVSILYAKNYDMNYQIAIFLCTILIKEQPKWSYGRKAHDDNKLGMSLIKLPIRLDNDGNPIIDPNNTFSSDGYIPDWDFMKNYICSLGGVSFNTEIEYNKPLDLKQDEWKEFNLNKIFKIQRGNGIDICNTTSFNPMYNHITRTGKDNGVHGIVDQVEGEIPFGKGSISLALGGTLGSCFLQKKEFYTGEHMVVLTSIDNLTDLAKLFIITVIMFECRIRYVPFGRELDIHIDNDFVLKLPAKKEGNDFIVDETKKYSDYGYIPDWDFMENTMKQFPFSDLI